MSKKNCHRESEAKPDIGTHGFWGISPVVLAGLRCRNA